ncbi:signal-transducing adaptor protein 2 isoform X1 [Equus quagga]|uniref:signal-transducing adaptor protein 2 isoform X1 n=1 Tax=Equus quagga TaxID=89248 RepID=UPI001EE2578A|nr:signal-transducing adaptor protein 2 isoform X1 [Equus quagga]
MASALSPPRVPKPKPKPKGALPSHYHESFLEKKGPRDQDYRKFWAGLRGLTLYFYKSNRDSQHVEKLDLGTFVKFMDEAPWGSAQDPGIHFSLVLRNQEVKFKVESLESREMWKGFILTVLELRVPSNLTLLPGHLYMMAEALAKEEARRALEVPSCFMKVSRVEAQLLLERYPECGNLLLRPSGDGAAGVSVTTRQMLNGTPVIRHYKVKHEGPKYVIDVEEPFSCASLDAVVDYFVSNTKKALVPFLLDDDYEKVLGYVEADKENGESVWVAPSAPAAPSPDPAPPKQPPPAPVKPVSGQDKRPPLPDQDENYVIPIADAPAANYVNEDVLPPGRPVILKPKRLAKVQAKPPKPPVMPKPGRGPSSQPLPHPTEGQPQLSPPSPSEPRGLNGSPARKPAGSSAQALFPTTGLGDVTAELEEKLQRRRALEHSAGRAGDQRGYLGAKPSSQK